MSHELTENDKMFAIGEKPWHGLGTVFAEGTVLSIGEAMEASGLNWNVELESRFRPNGDLLVEKSVVRKDTNMVIGGVGARYTPLQNEEAFKWFEPLVESKEVAFETAGSLKGGEIVWILAKMNKECMPIGKKEDVVCKYILLSHAHNGSQAIRSGFTPVRVVCNNTLSMSHNSASSKLLKVKHTKNSKDNLEKVREIMNLANQEFEATAEQYRVLASRSINSKDLEKYVKVVYGIKEDDKERITKKIIPLFENGRGTSITDTTYWRAYNAITEYNTWQYGNNADNRLKSLWFGVSQETNSRALEVALAMSA